MPLGFPDLQMILWSKDGTRVAAKNDFHIGKTSLRQRVQSSIVLHLVDPSCASPFSPSGDGRTAMLLLASLKQLKLPMLRESAAAMCQ